MSVNVPRRGPRTRRGRRWRPCRPSRPSPRRRASRRSTSRRYCWWVEGEKGRSATARGTLGRDSPASIGFAGNNCASVASRELDTPAIGRRFAGRGRASDRAKREAVERHAFFKRASAASSPRLGLAPALPASRRSLGSRRCARVGIASRLIGKNVRGVSRRERGRTACWCARRRAARRGRWWRRGKPSLRCLSCVEGEACADMRRAERAMGGRAFGKTRSARSSPKSPTLVGGF